MHKINNIQLINAPLDIDYIKSSRTGTFPPINITLLATFLQENYIEAKIEIIDGEINSLDSILCRIDADIVGISCNIMTYESAIIIAKEAYQKGAKVILGGPFPSFMPEKILLNRDFIDAVVVGDGEEALFQYVKGEQYDKIPNLVFRNNNQIIRNSEKIVPINSVPIPDYGIIELESYYKEFKNRYLGFKPFEKSLAIYSRKGCLWRDLSDGGCIFCMIPHNGVRYKEPKKMWDEIEHYFKRFGINYFWEVCDTFTEDDKWINEFLYTRPKHLSEIYFQIYGRPNHITERMARQLKELNVFEVFIGAESGDDLILKSANKGIRTEHTLRAVEALAKNDIDVILSFVLGLPGETSQTLEKTLKFAKKLYAFGNIKETSTSIMLPLPGSSSFEMLTKQEELKNKYDTDLLDLEELKRDWCKSYTFVEYEELKVVLDEILSMFPLNDSFERVNLKSAPMC